MSTLRVHTNVCNGSPLRTTLHYFKSIIQRDRRSNFSNSLIISFSLVNRRSAALPFRSQIPIDRKVFAKVFKNNPLRRNSFMIPSKPRIQSFNPILKLCSARIERENGNGGVSNAATCSVRKIVSWHFPWGGNSFKPRLLFLIYPASR